jgi:hypothetical protein
MNQGNKQSVILLILLTLNLLPLQVLQELLHLLRNSLKKESNGFISTLLVLLIMETGLKHLYVQMATVLVPRQFSAISTSINKKLD